MKKEYVSVIKKSEVRVIQGTERGFWIMIDDNNYEFYSNREEAIKMANAMVALKDYKYSRGIDKLW